MQKKSRHLNEFRQRLCTLVRQKRSRREWDWETDMNSHVWRSSLITSNNKTITESISLDKYSYIHMVDSQTFVISKPPRKEAKYDPYEKREHFLFKAKEIEVIQWIEVLRASTGRYFMYDSKVPSLSTNLPIEQLTWNSMIKSYGKPKSTSQGRVGRILNLLIYSLHRIITY